MAQAFGRKLGRGAHVSVFKNFGTAQVKYHDTEVEFVGARKESYSHDSRKPVVEDGTLEDDQNRRDFTINAMAVCLNKARFGELVDPFNGLDDLKERTIRTPLDPDITFSDDNDKLLKTVKGIGLKTAQRIIVDLKDKIATSGVETVNSEMFANPGNTEIHDEAVAALTMLGFAQAASQKVVAAILKEEPAAPVEKVIKLALKRL
jgi:hypothetical protein